MIEENVHGTVCRLLAGHVIVYNKLFTQLITKTKLNDRPTPTNCLDAKSWEPQILGDNVFAVAIF